MTAGIKKEKICKIKTNKYTAILSKRLPKY
jgi:hypothetical protein